MDASLHLEFAEFLAYDSPRKFGIDPQQQVIVTIFSSSPLLNPCCVVVIATGHENAVPNSNPMCCYLAGS